MLRESSGRWTGHIAHGTLETIHMGVHVIVEQLFGVEALIALRAFVVVWLREMNIN